MTPPFPLAGELAALGAAVLWAIAICLFKRFGARLRARVLNLIKSCIALACLGIACVVIRPPWPESGRDWWLLVASGVVGLALGDTAFFAALRRLGAQLTTTTQCAAPPLAALIGYVLLGETLGWRQGVGLALTVTSVAGVVWFGRVPGGADVARRTWRNSLPSVGLVLAFISALCQALGVILQRGGFKNDAHVLPGTILRFAPAVVLLAFVDLPGRVAAKRTTPKPESRTTPRELAIIAFAGFLGTFLGVFLLAVASKYAPAGVVSALSSTYPVWIVPIAVFILGERASEKVIVCTVAAVAGIVLLAT